MGKSGVAREDAEVIVDVVRELRGVGVNNHRPTIRAVIAMAKILAHRHAHARPDDPVFQWVYRDVLRADTAKVTHDGHSLMPDKVEEAVAKVFAGATKQSKARNTAKAATRKD
jgi:nitric oxide reductase NorQ protein